MLNRIIISIFAPFRSLQVHMPRRNRNIRVLKSRSATTITINSCEWKQTNPPDSIVLLPLSIESSSQPIFPLFSSKYERMNRLDMLRALRHYRENSNAMFKAATGFELGAGVDAPVTEESRKYDFLETDYH